MLAKENSSKQIETIGVEKQQSMRDTWGKWGNMPHTTKKLPIIYKLNK